MYDVNNINTPIGTKIILQLKLITYCHFDCSNSIALGVSIPDWLLPILIGRYLISRGVISSHMLIWFGSYVDIAF